MSTGWIVLGIIVILVLFALGAYNRLVALGQRVNQAFADIDVQLKQRHDLIPNLVETVKGYAAHERGTLDEVIKARNSAMSAQGPAQVSAAETQLSGALGRLIALFRTPLELYPKDVHFLGIKDRYFGSFYGTSPTAMLWQEYAKADARWGGADLGVVSLELLTVFIGGPLATYICYLLTKGYGGTGTVGSNGLGGKLVFWMTVLATGELYGGKLCNCSRTYDVLIRDRVHDILP
jgi:predicted Holliday junction resolvase-like endonuclease